MNQTGRECLKNLLKLAQNHIFWSKLSSPKIVFRFSLDFFKDCVNNYASIGDAQIIK
jgi:hypothetical protein